MNVELLDLKEKYPKHLLSSAGGRCSRVGKSYKIFKKFKKKDYDKSKKFTHKVANVLGHENILEHVVFTFSINKISRLAVEFIEHHRLASYTEKSFRLNQNDIKFYSGVNISFKPLVDLYNKLREEGIKAEEARNVLPLAVLTDLQMTVNARELIRMIKRFQTSYLDEVMDLSEKLKTHFIEVFGDYDWFNIPENSKEFPDSWMPYTDFANIDTTKPVFKIKNLYSEFETEHFDSSSRYEEGIKIKILWNISSSGLAQLRRHRMGVLLQSQPYIGGRSFVPKSKNDREVQKIIYNFKHDVMIRDNDWRYYMYCSFMGSLRKYCWITDLRNLKRFISLRSSKHAQKEIRFQSNLFKEELKKYGFYSEGKSNISKEK